MDAREGARRAGVTVGHLAAAGMVTTTTASRWLRGERDVSARTEARFRGAVRDAEVGILTRAATVAGGQGLIQTAKRLLCLARRLGEAAVDHE
jgi:hypothetical protein